MSATRTPGTMPQPLPDLTRAQPMQSLAGTFQTTTPPASSSGRDRESGRDNVILVYGFPENTRAPEIEAGLAQLLALLEAPSEIIVQTRAPFRRCNKGMILVDTHAHRELLLDRWYNTAEDLRTQFKGKMLIPVREKPLDVRRRAARMYEAARTLQSIVGEDAVEAIPGRFVICASGGDHDGEIVAQTPYGTDFPLFDVAAVQRIFGATAADSVRRALS